MNDAASLALIRFGAAAAEAGLLISTCGNASLRLDGERFIVSATGAPLARLDAASIAVVSLRDGANYSGPPPSMEVELHRRAYLARPGVGAVLHAQSPAATVLACQWDPPRCLDFIPEVPAYVRAHAYVPYAAPGSEALAASVAAALGDPEVTVVQMINHGQVVVGATWEKVVRRAVFFERACQMALHGPLRTIPPEEAAALRGYGRDG